MNIPVIFQFLKDLSANNNREWFNEHKAEYELARAEFDNFLADSEYAQCVCCQFFCGCGAAAGAEYVFVF